jgi:hypothetical protein
MAGPPAPLSDSRVRLADPAAVARLAVSAFLLVVAIFVAIRVLGVYPWNERIFDLWAYWSTRSDLDYALARPGESGVYIYSPAFAHLIAPLTALPLPLFAGLWTAIVAGLLYWLAGWRAFFLGLLAPVTMSVAIGQLDLIMAAAIVVGFRWPAAWVLPIITKLTPGIGLLWFAARGEWRALSIAALATLAVVGVSFAIDPAAWLGWIGMLARLEFPTPAYGVYLPVPLWVRLPLVAILIVWGARTDRRWTLPIAVCFSLPTVWFNTPTIMVAALPLLELGAGTPAGRWLRGTVASPTVASQRTRRRARRAGLVLRRGLAGLLAAASPPASRAPQVRESVDRVR